MLGILRHNMPAVWVERVRRSVRRKPEVASEGCVNESEMSSKEISSIVSFLGEVLRGFPEAKEAVLKGLRELRRGPLEPVQECT